MGVGGARVVGTMAANLARADDERFEALMKQHLAAAERMVEVLGTMKGAAMKLGQLASFVEADFVPEEFRPLYQEVLAQLRDSAPPMSWDKIRRVLREEWGEDPERVLAEVETEASAAASVGQVHRAVLEDGRVVAVKVQYPGVDAAIRADLQNVGLITSVAKAVAPGLDARAVAAEIRERVMEELDYELEAQNQREFARAYRGHPFVYVPGVITELSRTRVLVSEWVDGIPFAEVKRLPQEERDRFGEIVDRFYYGSMLHVGAFNADPHPGNYFLLGDGRGAFLDFGSVARISRERLQLYYQLCLAGVRGDWERAHELVAELGYFKRPDKIAVERLTEQMLASSGWLFEDREVRVDAELVQHALAVTMDARAGFFDVMRRASMPPEDVLMRRLDAGVVSVLGQLGAKRNWQRIGREYWEDAEPSTELGREEWSFWQERAPRRRNGSHGH